ncbi:MAG: MBOAT family protein [Erysipelotrichaceae bacterium]|nr:MBOAT family protein [Erysipelotrichaceae bacterium]MDY6034461.1 MBOAT family O-acyltransferase [Bulleidia sp.]
MNLSYNALGYLVIFLPLTMLLYQLVRQKYRWIVLLVASLVFFGIWSTWLIAYCLVTVGITFFIGRKLGSMKKAPEGVDKKLFKKQKRRILTLGIVLNLGVLLALKYTNFFASGLFGLLQKSFTPLTILVPIGISYYTLQLVSYLADINSGKIEPVQNYFHLLLFATFFPTLVEGPIARYSEIGNPLLEGNAIKQENVIVGFERILWGMFKKVAIADHMAPVVTAIFDRYTTTGGLVLLGGIFCTIQLYMDFSGSIDIAIGSAKVFGITLPENFTQPFFAKGASDFWHRWHITLGTFFRDYIFYPVSLSKPIMKLTKWSKKHLGKAVAKYIGPMIALLCVWISNGLWHGPQWNYILYGLYYFVLIFAELLLEKPVENLCKRLHISQEGVGYRIFRFIKLLIIVVVGETVFATSSWDQIVTMFTSLFTNFNWSSAWNTIPYLGMDAWDYITVAIAFVIVVIVDILKEIRFPIRKTFESKPIVIRWSMLYLVIFYIIFFGAYGPGYDIIKMMYAGF